MDPSQSNDEAQLQSSTESFLIRYQIEAHEDVHIRTNISQTVRCSPKSLESYQVALASENCALSIYLPRHGTQKGDALQLFRHVLQTGAKGLSSAVRRGQNQLLLVYENSRRRDRALEALSSSSMFLDVKQVTKICSKSSRRYVVWTFQVRHHVAVEELLAALNYYFSGTGYSSRCVVSWTSDRLVRYFIIFEHTPPYLGDTLKKRNGKTISVFQVRSSTTVLPPKINEQQNPDTSQGETGNTSGDDLDTSDQEDSSESQGVDDLQEDLESASEVSGEPGDIASLSEASGELEDFDSSSEDEAEHNTGVQVAPSSKSSSNPTASDAINSAIQKERTSQFHRTSPSKIPSLHVEEERDVQAEFQSEIANSLSSADTSEQSESQSDSSASSEKSGQDPSHAQDGVAMTIATKRKVSCPIPTQTISTDLPQRIGSPSASHSSSNTHSTTISQPAPFATQPTAPSLSKFPNARSQLNRLNSISQPKDPKQPSFPIRTASKLPSKIARLTTKDEEEEDPLALLERHVEEYALRLKRESTS